MTDTKKHRSLRLANSFSLAEARALLELLAVVLRGGDARQIAQSADVANVARKFVLMRKQYERHAATGAADHSAARAP